MNASPKVSVIVPVYNVEKYLRQCLDSIVNQTCPDIEIICVNDGSTDNCAQILEEYAQKDSRIIVITQENQGLSAARNAGIQRSTGEYLQFVDSDDYLDFSAVEKLFFYAKNHQLDVLSFGGKIEFEVDSEQLGTRFPQGENALTFHKDFSAVQTGETLLRNAESLEEYKSYAWLYLIRRDYLKNVNLRFIDGILQEDAPFTFELFLCAKRAARMNDLFYHYRVRANSIMTETNPKTIFKRMEGYFYGSLSMTEFAERRRFGSQTRDSIDRILKSRRKQCIDLYRKIPRQEQMSFYEALSDVERNYFDSFMAEDEETRLTIDRYVKLVGTRLETVDTARWKIPSRVAIYGSGRLARQLYDKISGLCSVVCFFGGGKMESYKGTPLYPIDFINQIDADAIIVSSLFDLDHITNMLKTLDEKKREILCLHNLVGVKITKSKKSVVSEIVRKMEFWRNEVLPIHRFKMGNACPVFLINTPEHGNLGDHAIAYATHKFLTACGVSYYEVSDRKLETLKHFGFLGAMDRAIILVCGGGNLGTLWFHIEERYRNVIRANKRATIVFLPNTVYYEDSQWGNSEFDKALTMYREHKNVSVYVREKISYDILKKHYSKTFLAPDMVMLLEECRNAQKRSGCLLCLRNDKEQTLKADEIAVICEQASGLFGGEVRETTTVLPYKVPAERREAELQRKLDEFRAAELVITDRLHGMIFCAVTGTPCIVTSSRSHKLKGCYEWLKHLDYIKFADGVEDIEKLYRTMTRGQQVYKPDGLEAHFDTLKAHIKRLTTQR